MRWGLLLMILLSAFAPGCGTRVILIPPGAPVQLREPLPAKVWVFDAKQVRAPGDVTLPAGWYCLPDPGRPPSQVP